MKHNKISEKLSCNIGEVNNIKKRKEHFQFALCIRSESSVSITEIKKNIHQTLLILKDLLIKLKLDQVNFAKGSFIKNLVWSEFLNLLELVLRDSKIKILICMSSVNYISLKNEVTYFMNYISHLLGGTEVFPRLIIESNRSTIGKINTFKYKAANGNHTNPWNCF